MPKSRVVAFVMAGGEGVRLRPLTEEAPKPALPFMGGHRIIDFALSNLYNSGIRSVFVLLQYRPQSLLGHLAQYWAPAVTGAGEFAEPVLPSRNGSQGGFRGTADAVHQNLDLLDGRRPDLVAVFAADHVYRMDVRQMIDFHEARDADVTVAAVPVLLEQASGFGVVEVDGDGKILKFVEKPREPTPLPGNPQRCLASMGNYLFRPGVLRRALAECAARGEHDFGGHVLPRLVATHRIYAYDFSTNVVPGRRAHEEPGYWRDVGTVEGYVEAHRDLLGPRPRFCLDNHHWPLSCGNGDAIRVRSLNGGNIIHSIVDAGSSFGGAWLRHAVLQGNARIDPGASIEECLIMDGARVGRGVHLRRALVGPRSALAAGASIGHDPFADFRRYTVTPGGIIVVPPRTRGSAPARAATPPSRM